MSFFDSLFGSSEPNKVTNESSIGWNELREIKQLDEMIETSFGKPVFIFKHSTRCGISKMVLKNFENHYDLSNDEIQPYFLDLLSHRDISNEIASRFDVIHQSPQIILIKDGKCNYTASHSDIDVDDIKEKIRS